MIKCLVWDLDDTLWTGTLADEEEVVLKPGVENVLRELAGRGIIHSIASRNDEEAVRSQLDRFGLSRYFVFPQCGWHTKVDSLRRLSRVLNLQLKHMAFVDDNEFERAEVAAFLPEVMIIPADEALSTLEMPEFTPSYVSADGARRLERYHALERRQQEEQNWSGTRDAFLRHCDMRLRVQRPSDQDLDRIAELSHRANRFHSSKTRYDIEDLRALCEDPNRYIFAGWFDDRFGEHGMIAFAVVRKTETTAHLETIVVSCRVEGRGIGSGFIGCVVGLCRSLGCSEISTVLARTKLNRQMHLVLRQLGFEPIESTHDAVTLGVAGTVSVALPGWLQLQVVD